MPDNKVKFAFFGTSEFAVIVLENLKEQGILPTTIVTAPDKPVGRKQILTPPPVKIWAMTNDVEYLQPPSLKDPSLVYKLSTTDYKLFLVAAYGKIIPKTVFDLPESKTLNIHPSLLPKLRGPSPLQTAILENQKETGVSIMQIDEKMDHGPIVAQEKIKITNWPPTYGELENLSAKVGADLFVKILPDYISGKLKPVVQDETEVTNTKLIEKEDGEINLDDDPYKNFLKIQAYERWPGTYFFTKNGEGKTRILIKSAEFKNNKLNIIRIVPEGKKEIAYSEFI